MILLSWAVTLLYYVVILHVIMSWLISFQVLNIYQPIVGKAWYGLNRILEPIYTPIRRVLPNTAGLDFAPLVVLIGVIILRRMLHI